MYYRFSSLRWEEGLDFRADTREAQPSSVILQLSSLQSGEKLLKLTDQDTHIHTHLQKHTFTHSYILTHSHTYTGIQTHIVCISALLGQNMDFFLLNGTFQVTDQGGGFLSKPISSDPLFYFKRGLQIQTFNLIKFPVLDFVISGRELNC